MKRIEVAVGVILRGKNIFISKRADHLHQGGKWEFPGGKRELGESFSQALARELDEEIGIQVVHDIPLIHIEHDYTDKQVCLDVRIVDEFEGEPENQEGQISMWASIEELTNLEFPDANQPIIQAVKDYLG